MMRTADITRNTKETQIRAVVNLDGKGVSKLDSGIPFLDHMIDQIARHGMIDIELKATGDLHIDAHHTVEDVGLCFGKALNQAIGDKAGIRRFGAATVPMDETLVTAAVDLSGRPFLEWRAEVPFELLGNYSSSLTEEFWRAASSAGLFNLHVVLHHGRNTHHIVEAIFKACARALRAATEADPLAVGVVPSTKGVL